MFVGETIDNRTICDLFEVANMGGIRVSQARSHIVLISNNTDPTYRNEWGDGTLHFVGMGSIGPQKLHRQNKTLANSKRYGWTVHLFEVFEKGRYVYAGEVELAADPYFSDQPDARADARFVWISRCDPRRPPRSPSARCPKPRPSSLIIYLSAHTLSSVRV
jgi:5-methylcytosine-specific restriction enzyme A